jgi:hypothetical protein
MKEMNYLLIRSILIIVIMSVMSKVNGQTIMPEELNKNSLKEQLKYLEDRTRIYENYRAIREDIFQKLKVNVSDTLLAVSGKIYELNNKTVTLKHVIDSLNKSLAETKSSLKEITRTKNSIRVFGLEINKVTYNTIMWTVIAGLLALVVTGFLIFIRNLTLTSDKKKELKELKEEFEAYRKTSREAREKMSMDHFNEIKKMKGG